MPKYLERRGNIFWFRRRAPLPLKPHNQVELGDRLATVNAKGFIRFSLATGDSKEAARLARKYAHLIDEAIAAQREPRPTSKNWKPLLQLSPQEPSAEEIQFAADSLYASLLALDEMSLKQEMDAAFSDHPSKEAEDHEGEDFVSKVISNIRGGGLPGSAVRPCSVADLPPATPQGQALLIKDWIAPISFALAQHAGKTVSAPSSALLPFANAIRRYVGAAEQRSQSIDVPTPPMPSKGQLWSWDDAFDYYFQQRPFLGQSTHDNYRLAWSSLAASAKGVPLELTRSAVVAWRDQLFNEVERVTVKNRMTYAKAIWRESRVNGKIPQNTLDPFEGLQVRIDQNSVSSRQEYSNTELKAIFSASPVVTAKAVSVHAGYWIPMIGLHHGGRLEEITGLEVRDVEDWDDSLVIHIRQNSIRPKLKNGRRSERTVPAHPKLLELGFREYVLAARKAGVVALFPSFSRGATFGEAFVDHVKNLIKPVPGRLIGMHPLRHNWETARRNARLHPSAAQYIAGRKIEQGSSAEYGVPAGRGVLLEELSKIEYGLQFLPAPAVTAEELKRQDAVRVMNQRAKRKSQKNKPAMAGKG